MWRQRTRAIWLRDGDRNTRFFHGKADQRRKTNTIKKMKDSNGNLKRGDKNYENILLDYFLELFATSNPSDISKICSIVKGKLFENSKEWCGLVYSAKEVKEAL